MKIVSDNIKNALKQPTTQRKGRILVNGNYYEVYNVEYFADAYEDGNVIGNAIASQLDFDLPYMDKFDSFKYFDGVWTGNEYEYVDMGTFTVFDEQDEDEFNKHITAFDNLIKFNKFFEEKGTYPKTLYQELKNVCQQANVELVNTSIPNGNFEVENNQFVNGETLKTVLKAICQISGNYGIIKEDKLVLQLTNDTGETILKNQHEPVVWKRKTYGINQVILQLGDVEGEYVIRQDDEDIAENGVHKLVITNNPFAYTQDKRDALIDALFNQVHGFGYIPFEMNCEWLNYLEIGDKIINDDIETIVLRIRGKSPKSLESMISAPAIIDSAVEYVNNANSIKNQINRTEIIVDKQNQEIELIASKTEETTKTLKTEKSVESNGEEIYIEDSGGYDLEKLRIDGKSVQETRSGNLFTSPWEKGNIDGTTGYNIEASDTVRTDFIEIKPSVLYTMTRNISTSYNTFRFYDKDKKYLGNQTTNGIMTSDSSDNRMGTNVTSISFTITNKNVAYIRLTDTSNNLSTVYTMTTSVPIPDYPSEIESVGYSNLFDKDNEIVGYVYTSTGSYVASKDWNTNDDFKKINDNTVTVSAKTTNAFNSLLIEFDKDKKFIQRQQGTTLIKTFTLNENTKYIRYCYPNNLGIYDIQLEKGSTIHSYIPYGKYGIEVKTVGNNLFDLQDGTISLNGITAIVNNGIITLNGTATDTTFLPITTSSDYYINDGEDFTVSTNNPIANKNVRIRINANGVYDTSLNVVNRVATYNKTSEYPLIGTRVQIRVQSGTTLENYIIKPMLEKSSIATEFQPYQEKTSVLQLNAPLRSLPNGVKDKAYIKNNKLYVDRKVASVVFDGSNDEGWEMTYGTSLFNRKISNMNALNLGISNCFVFDSRTAGMSGLEDNTFAIQSQYEAIFFKTSKFTTVEEWKTWLSNNNVQVDYALATPITEELGFVSIPTFENINHINLYGKISTSFGITYLTNSHLNEQFATKSEIKITNDEINILSKKIQPVSNTIKKTGEIQLENAHEGILHKLVITGNISLIYPSNDLYPSDNLYPKIFKLQVDEKIYELDLDCLNYINSNIYDEFVYENSKCYVIRRIGIDENGELYQLENEIIETKKDLIINVLENSKITLLEFENAILSVEYLLQNQYSNVFASEAYVNSEIKQTADEINIEVSKKVNEDEVVNKINVSTEKVLLKGNRVVIESDNFNLNADGKITATAGKVGGFEMDNQSFSKELNGIYNYNYFDTILTAIAILKRISIDSNLSEVLDVNNDNNITAVDYSVIKNIIKGESENNKFLKGLFEINSSDPKNCISIKDELGEVIASLGLGGINSTYVTCNNFVCGYPSESAGEFIGTTINGETGNVTCVSLTQTSQEKYKKNFEKLENALDIVKQTDIYQYHLKNQHDEEKKHIGFVIGENYNYSQEITSPNNDGADIYSMVSVCFKAIQEQQEQIKMLKNEINQLKEMIK